MKSCLLCGVGGQGTVLASRILATAAMEQGWFARTAETIGMAQRGGCVVSHVRFGDKVYASMIPQGGADVLIGFEPGEAVRCLPYLKPDGCLIVCDKPVMPVSASLNRGAYDGGEMLEFLRSRVPSCRVISAAAAVQACGTPKVLNVVLVGAAVACGKLELEQQAVERALAARVKPAYLEMNRKALELGAEMVR